MEPSESQPGVRGPEPWDLALARLGGPGTLVAIGREARLALQSGGSSRRVGVSPVDMATLALVDLALRHGRDLTLVYPAPAGHICTLLAAGVLLDRFSGGSRSPSVGILTADAATTTATWQELAVSAQASLARVAEVFPAFRAGPDGESPFRRNRFQGLLVGQVFEGWPVDAVIVDHLSGPVFGRPNVPAIRVFADPLDPELRAISDEGGLIWGWAEQDLADLGHCLDIVDKRLASFSVASERLRTMAADSQTTIHVIDDQEAAALSKRLRDDLRSLAAVAGPNPEPGIVRGIRASWHHVGTLTSLPCRPSEFDRYAGVPPIAARPTSSFEPELNAWARGLTGDMEEIVDVLASDLADLRSALEARPPFQRELETLLTGPLDSLAVLRTRTAARSFAHLLSGSRHGVSAHVHVTWLRRLKAQMPVSKVVAVGSPARWDWHRLDSGLTPDLHVLVLGSLDGDLAERTLFSLRQAREYWARGEARARVWRELVGGAPPAEPAHTTRTATVAILNRAVTASPDPLDAFEGLLTATPLWGDTPEAIDLLAQEADDGQWHAAVKVVDIVTDVGSVMMPLDHLVDVRNEDRVEQVRAADLKPGGFLLLGSRSGQVGLFEALADRLEKRRPDLVTARLLIDVLRASVQNAFRKSGMTRVELFERLRLLGFGKSYHAVRGYVDEHGPLAPRDLADLSRLNDALELGFTDRRLNQVFMGVQRQRGFRRAVGRALMASARDSVAAGDAARLDREMGLSLADLRDLVVQARIVAVREHTGLVPVSDTGRVR